MKTINGKEYLTVLDVCEKLGVSRNTVYQYIRLGKLKVINPSKIGREYLIEKGEFNRFLHS